MNPDPQGVIRAEEAIHRFLTTAKKLDDTGHKVESPFFRLVYPSAPYPITATFAYTVMKLDRMAVCTRIGYPAQEASGFYPVEEARAFYRELISLGFDPF